MSLVRAFIGLGANLADPERQVRLAFSALEKIEQTSLIAKSSAYRTRPVGPAQPDYVNAVAELSTALEPHALLNVLLAIERQGGRVRTGERWGPRTIDLDLLLYGDMEINEQGLTIPHAGISQRRFVLVPLVEIAPDISIPGMGEGAALLASCPPGEVELLHYE